MQRIAFQLRVRSGAEEAYDRAHRQVWPKLLAELEAYGVREYSIFRRGNELFLYMLVPDFDVLLHKLAHSEVNRRWQEAMAPLLEKVPSLRTGETFAMMEEVFYLPGHSNEEAAHAQPSQEREYAE